MGSKARATSFAAEEPPSAERLESLFSGDWLSRRIVTLPIDAALAKGFDWVDADDDERATFAAANYTDAYPEGIFQNAAYLGRLHGGAALVFGFANGDPGDELPSVPGEVRWMLPASRHDFEIVEFDEDANSDTYGEPLIIKLTSGLRKDLLVHTSRVIWFEGDPAIGARKNDDELKGFFSESVLRAPMRALERYGMAWESVGVMLQESDISVLKIKGLIDSIASENGQQFRDRFRLMAQTRGLTGTILLDADEGEDFTRNSINLGGVQPVLDMLALEVSGAAQMPATVLLGRAPAGLNATGESDLAVWYDRLESLQTNRIGTKLAWMVEWIIGRPVEIEFEALWQMSEAERATLRKTQFEADSLLQTLGVDGLAIVRARAEDGTLGVELADEDIADDGNDETQQPPPGQPGQFAPPSGALDPTAPNGLPEGSASGAPNSNVGQPADGAS